MITFSKKPFKISTDHVRLYYYQELDQRKQQNSGVIVDDACYELMFVKEKDVKLINEGKESYLLPPAYTVNNLSGPFKFEFSDTFTSFCIKLQPWMNASFVPVEKSQLLNLNTVYPGQLSHLHDQLFSSKSFNEMTQYAEEFLIAANIKPNKEVDLIRDVCKYIYENSGNVTVNELADRFNIYRQKLSALFRKEVKYTIKKFINCIRISACLKYKLKHPEMSLTEIGHKFGSFELPPFPREG